MKKTFKLQVENKKPEHQLESIKNEVRKYLKRERKKKLPEDAIYWDFECQFGQEKEEAKSINISELTASLDEAHAKEWGACYIEIIAKPSMKQVSEKSSEETEDE